MSEHISPDGLYRQGLSHFNRGAWQEAIDAFSRLQTSGHDYPGVAELIADARFKQQIESAEAPSFMAPPRVRKLPRVLVLALLCLLIGRCVSAVNGAARRAGAGDRRGGRRAGRARSGGRGRGRACGAAHAGAHRRSHRRAGDRGQRRYPAGG